MLAVERSTTATVDTLTAQRLGILLFIRSLVKEVNLTLVNLLSHAPIGRGNAPIEAALYIAATCRYRII